MNRPNDDLDRALDQILTELRDLAPGTEAENTATERVWQRIGGEIAAESADADRGREIRSCDDFRALIPAYLAGRLASPRRLLLDDHLGECVPCRRALHVASAGVAAQGPRPARAAADTGWLPRMAWRLAAAAVVVLALLGLTIDTKTFYLEAGGLIHVHSLEGGLYRVTEDGNQPLAVGDEITLKPGEGVRTAKGSTAVLRLADDSEVEMRERSELSVKERRSWIPGRRADGVIDLDRGSVIVEASKQGSGHLYVQTDDCRVAVTGTVFSVNHGVKGSRVSVIEGEVHVDYAGNQNVLQPGQQVTTNPSLTRVPLDQEIAWSRNVEHYETLLREVRALGREMDAALSPGSRHSTDLLDVAPADTVVYVGMPNLTAGLGEAYRILRERVAASEVLRAWWDDVVAGTEAADQIDQMIERIRTVGGELGEEVVLTLRQGADGQIQPPLLLSRLARPEQFRALVEAQIDALDPDGHDRPHLSFLEGPLPETPPAQEGSGDAHLYVWMHEGLLAVSPEFATLRSLSASTNPVRASSAFHDRLTDLYRDGVEWVVGVDVERLVAGAQGAPAAAMLEQLGLLDAQHLLAEHERLGDRAESRIALTFDQPRRGAAAWLAAPASMGSLEFVSPDAHLAVGFVMKDMRSLVDEMFGVIAGQQADFDTLLEEFERENGIDVREDFAAPLGGEFAFALDGPVLPVPSWKLVLEVYDPARLQHTIEWLVDRLNRAAAEHGGPQLTLTAEQVGGRESWRVEARDTGLAAHYAFADGYLVAAPSLALVERALQVRATGVTLPSSPRFTALLPRDRQVNFSAVVYQNLAPILGPLAGAAGGSEENRRMAELLGSGNEPSLALVYGEERQIAVAGTSQGGLFSSSLGTLLQANSLRDVRQFLPRSDPGASGSRQ